MIERTFKDLKPGDLFRFSEDPETPSGDHYIRLDPGCEFLRSVPEHERKWFCVATGTGVVTYIGADSRVFHVPRADRSCDLLPDLEG